MKISVIKEISDRKNGDCLIVPFFEDKRPIPACHLKDIERDLKWSLEVGDFRGKDKDITLLYIQGRKENRILLLGLGKKEKVTAESLRNSLAEAIKKCQKIKCSKVNLLFPEKCKLPFLYQNVLEGVSLPNYFFNRLKKDSLKEDDAILISELTIVGIEPNKELIEKINVIITANHMVRDLVNNNADEETPQRLGQVAKELEKISAKVKVTVFDKKRIIKEKMGLLLAVNRGSFRDPAFIILEYNGDKNSKDKTALIGKGITFDSGGLDLKTPASMYTMRSDMAGAAAVLGVIYAIASLDLKKNVVGIIPATENSIGSKSYKPGDVYTSYSGKTVEVGNTDAEGRLILADAISYTVDKIKPRRIIDLATLTGAITIALGNEIAGIFSNDMNLIDQLVESGKTTGELLWPMPLYEEYKLKLKSDFADIKNIGDSTVGAISGALFLKEFVKDIPWAHLDIAGPAFYEKPKGYNNSPATGFGVRLLFDFFEKI
jgi:leucyl aminopeptidase